MPMAKHLAFPATLAFALVLSSCGSAPSDRPWQAYAWDSKARQFTWLWMNNAATRDDCLFLAQRYIKSMPGLERPNCAFQSNDEFWARAVGLIYGASDFQCLARSTSKSDAEAGRTYSYILGSAREGEDWYCI